MNEEEILEGNKLLAEFDGIKIGKSIYSWRIGCREPIQEHHLNYHASWGWIMPLIGKIKKMQHDPIECFMGTTLERYAQFNHITEMSISTPMESVYERLVDFVKWYNSKKPNP